MNFVTYNNIRLKCLINLFILFYMAPHEVAGSLIVARAIDKFQSLNTELKKRTCFLSTVYFRLQNLGVLRSITVLRIFSA